MGAGGKQSAAKGGPRARLRRLVSDSGRAYNFQASNFLARRGRLMAGMEAPSADQLETFANPAPGRDYTIEIVCPEYTSLCPLTGQPDFGTITLTYTPNERCVELKSLKLYLQRYRSQGAFYEAVVNRILDDFVAACQPERCRIVGAFTPRGGITTTVTCVYEAPRIASPKA
jgi:7-cyano-7-deazaguanine reductase